MKKIISLAAIALGVVLAGCCGKCDPCGKSKSKKPMTHKAAKAAPVKRSMNGKMKSEVDKIWCEVCNMWTAKGHKH